MIGESIRATAWPDRNDSRRDRRRRGGAASSRWNRTAPRRSSRRRASSRRSMPRSTSVDPCSSREIRERANRRWRSRSRSELGLGDVLSWNINSRSTLTQRALRVRRALARLREANLSAWLREAAAEHDPGARNRRCRRVRPPLRPFRSRTSDSSSRSARSGPRSSLPRIKPLRRARRRDRQERRGPSERSAACLRKRQVRNPRARAHRGALAARHRANAGPQVGDD